MEKVFLQLANMSISAGWIVLAVILLRLLLKKAPKWINCLLWAVVALRLIFPFSLESPVSLQPSAEPIPQYIITAGEPTVSTAISIINGTADPAILETRPADELTATKIASVVWVCGVVILALYSVGVYIHLRRKMRFAVKLEDNIFQCENATSPFILGLIRPRIYILYGLSEEKLCHILAHERAHLKRRDHLIKPFAFLLLTVYWFNPLIWVAYLLLCRDIELSCDEKVIGEMEEEDRRLYSLALLECSSPRRLISACPVAFGEVGVKTRIKSVMNYKKPAFWLIIGAVVCAVVLAVCFLTNPKDEEEKFVLDDEETDSAWNEVEPVYVEFDLSDAEIYYYGNSPDIITPTVALYPNSGRFQFSWSSLSSYIADGTYEEKDGYVVLTTDDGLENVYTFKREGKSLLFCKDRSSKIPSYGLEGQGAPVEPVPDGSEFKISVFAETMTIASTSFDIDGDGKEEQLSISPGITSGIFSFFLKIYSDGELKYSNLISYLPAGDLSFATSYDGKELYIKVKSDVVVRYFGMSFSDGNIILTEKISSTPKAE